MVDAPCCSCWGLVLAAALRFGNFRVVRVLRRLHLRLGVRDGLLLLLLEVLLLFLELLPLLVELLLALRLFGGALRGAFLRGLVDRRLARRGLGVALGLLFRRLLLTLGFLGLLLVRFGLALLVV